MRSGYGRRPLGLLIFGLTTSCLSNAPDQADTDSNTAAIIGGQPASETSIFATVVLLRDGLFGCSGVLIAPTIALTAGHCVTNEGSVLKPSGLAIRAGTLNADSPSTRTDLNDVPVKTIHLHPNFVERSPDVVDPESRYSNDLAVLKLSMPIKAIDPTPIFPETQLTDLQDEDSIVMAGYGCRQYDKGGPSGVLFESESFQYLITPALLYVAGPPRVCAGDSGGPAYVIVNKRRWVLGIVSSVHASLSFFVPVSRHEPWIRSVTQQDPTPEIPKEPAPPPSGRPEVPDMSASTQNAVAEAKQGSSSCICGPFSKLRFPYPAVLFFLPSLFWPWMPRLQTSHSCKRDNI